MKDKNIPPNLLNAINQNESAIVLANTRLALQFLHQLIANETAQRVSVCEQMLHVLHLLS